MGGSVQKSSRRLHVYAAVLVVSLFLGIVFLLSLKLSTHLSTIPGTISTPVAPRHVLSTVERWENLLSGVAPGSFTFHPAEVTRGVDGVEIWRVVSHQGAIVSLHHPMPLKSQENAAKRGKNGLVQVLPKGAVLIGVLMKSNESESNSGCQRSIDTIQVHYPVRGWLHSGDCSSNRAYESIIKLREDESKYIRRKTEIPEEPSPICKQLSTLPGVDLVGGDVAPFPEAVSSPAECCARCSKLRTCGGWTMANQKDCWLKYTGKFKMKVLPEGPAKKNMVSGVLPTHNGTGLHSSASAVLVHDLFPPCCPLQNVDAKVRETDHSSSPQGDESTVYIKSSALDWTSQFPVGTGSVGALVGGLASADIVPLSAAGFFVTRESSIPSTSAGLTDAGEIPSGTEQRTHMSVARDAYLRNDVVGAHAAIGKAINSGQLISGRSARRAPILNSSSEDKNTNRKKPAPARVDVAPLGNFEYLCDLSIVFGVPLSKEDEFHATEEGASKKRKLPKLSDERGRKGVLGRLYSFIYQKSFISSISELVSQWESDIRLIAALLTARPPCSTCTGRHSEDSNLVRTRSHKDFADIYLDTRTGLVNSYFLKSYSLPLSDELFDSLRQFLDKVPVPEQDLPFSMYYHLQERTWFASLVDDVVVGSMKSAHIKNNIVSDEDVLPKLSTSGMLVRAAGDITLSITRDILKIPESGHLFFSAVSFSWPEIETLVHLSETSSTATVVSREQVLQAAGKAAEIQHSDVYGFDIELSSLPQSSTKSPNAVVCAAVLCIRSKRATTSPNHHSASSRLERADIPTDSNTIFCPAVEEVQIYVATETGKSQYSDKNIYHHVNDTEELRLSCWIKLNRAINRGYDVVKSRHTANFARRNEGQLSEVSFKELSNTKDAPFDRADDENQVYETCADAPSAVRLGAFGSGCVLAAVNERDNFAENEEEYVSAVDANLFSQLYNYGLYLMVSSGSKSVSNLQGLWADGPTSAWSGDYHMNINLQMNYWAIHGSGLANEVYAPFSKLIEQLSISGKSTAASMYGCKGWMAHGFTDASLRAHLHADGQWALCVTCGAWVALHLWEGLLYEPVSTLWVSRLNIEQGDSVVTDIKTAQNLLHLIERENITINSVVNIFCGVAEFFTDYFYVDSAGNVHSGPTTSPENSYFMDETTTEYLTMSPAIDMSVLRQVSGALLIALSWQRTDIKSSLEWIEETLSQFDTVDLRTSAYSSMEKTMSILNKAKQLLHAKKSRWQHDADIAARFVKLVQRMPGEANPMVEPQMGDSFSDTESEIISEYPGLLPGGGSNSAASSIFQTRQHSDAMDSTAQALDLGHRHWSSLHWLYPGLLAPLSFGNNRGSRSQHEVVKRLQEAAHNTVMMKLRAGGGHTGWSAVWGASLLARLGDGDGAMRLLSRTIQRYTAPNMMGLHPALASRGIKKCDTCFYDASVNFVKSMEDFRTSGTKESILDPYSWFKKKPSVNVPKTVTAKLPLQDPQQQSRKLLNLVDISPIHPTYPENNWTDSIFELAHLQTRRRTPVPVSKQPNVVPTHHWSENQFFGKGLSGDAPLLSQLRGSVPKVNAAAGKPVDQDMLGPLRPDRGMVTVDDAKFQFDTNAGFVAAVNEMLLHSHVPGLFSLLPALPSELSDFGRVNRLRCRGGVSVSFMWSQHEISEATVVLNYPHPWLSRIEEDADHPGYPKVPEYAENLQGSAPEMFSFPELNKEYDVEIVLTSPNKLMIMSTTSNLAPDVACARSSGDCIDANSERHCLNVQVSAFPCSITLRAR